jgi:hypothetical protein
MTSFEKIIQRTHPEIIHPACSRWTSAAIETTKQFLKEILR